MKKLTEVNLLSIFGGWANPEACRNLQIEASLMEQEGATPDEWDNWGNKFDRDCLGI